MNHFSILKNYYQALYQEVLPFIPSDHLVIAKEIYFNLTGKVDEEDDDFDARMGLFNDWFLLEYAQTHHLLTPFTERLPTLPKDILKSIRYGIFKIHNRQYSKNIIVYDLAFALKLNCINLPQEIPLVANDLFLGRIYTDVNNSLLLGNMRPVPSLAEENIVSHCKDLRRSYSIEKLQQLPHDIDIKTSRYIRYGHVGIDKIFSFN